ncbi:hypothetical protein [Porphyromonas gingivalis]|uniref:hypothetical protein n=1 Tax=Porphyromonas gingivalis TaxID=837 RepID=UPI0015CF05C2|nr:hypothetical protein [Porphyromonas gingivalis]
MKYPEIAKSQKGRGKIELICIYTDKQRQKSQINQLDSGKINIFAENINSNAHEGNKST